MEIPRDEVQKRNDAKKNLYFLFHQKVDKDVIDMVLAQCKYDEKNAMNNLSMMAGDVPEKPPASQHNQIPVPLTDASIVKYAVGSKPGNSFDNSSRHQDKPSSLLDQMTLPELSIGSRPMNSFNNNEPHQDKPSSLLEQMTSPGLSVRSKPVNSFNDSEPYQVEPSNLLEQIKSPALSVSEVSQLLPLSNSGYVTTFPNYYSRSNSIVRTPSKTISSIFNSQNSYATTNATTEVTCSTTGKAIEMPLSGSATGSKDNSVARRTPFFSTPPKNDISSGLSKTDESFKHYINDPARKVLVLMRGLPGSGKSHKASKLCGKNGLVLSTDDFFYINGRYQFNPDALSDAHAWNQLRAKSNMKDGKSPIFIDNTNMQVWEMQPYAKMAKKNDYIIKIVEPDTEWAWKPSTLARKNSHDVTKESIRRMMDKYQPVKSIGDILNALPEEGAADKSMQQDATNNRVNLPKELIRKHENVRSDPRSIVRKSSRNSAYAHDQSTDDSRRSPRNFRNRNGPDRSSPIGSPNSRRNFIGQRNENIDLNSIPFTHSTHSQRLSEERTLNKEIPSNQLSPSNSLVKEDGSPMNVDCHLPPSLNPMDNTANMQHYKKPSPSDRFNTADYDDIKSVQMASNHPTDMQNIGSCSKANTGNLENRLSESRIGMLTESYKQWTSQHEMEDMETSVGVGAPKSSNGEIKLQRVPSQEQMEFGLQFLCECFPDFRKSFLKDWLKRYNGDIVKTSDYLSRFSQLDLPDNVSESSDVVVVQDEDYDMDDDVVEQREIIDLSTPPREPKEPMGKLYFCDDDEQMKIAIDKRLGMELMKNFADESKEIGDLDEEDYLVEIDEEFKRLLFNKWMSSLKARKRRMQTFLEDDEAYARRLQNEEENQMKGRKKKRKTKQLNVPTNFSKEQPAQLFSTNAWEKDEQKQDTSSPQKVKDASGHVLTKKQLKIRELLYELFPGVDEHALNDVLEANSYNLEAATNIVKSSCGVATTALRKNKSKQKVQVPGCSKDVTIVTERTGEVGRFQSMSEDNQDYGNIRAEAELHKQQRIEFYQKAAIAFEKKQGQLAQYYADMGNQHTQKMKEAHARAAELILQRKNKVYMKDQQTIDLHGLHPNEAVLAVKNFIRNAYNIKHSWVDIITGRGLNSKTRGKSTVRNAVVSYLDKARFRYEEKSSGGMLRVSLLR